MNNDFKNSLQEETCLTRKEIQDYAVGGLAGSSLRRVELHLADCELCSDALDGFKLLTNDEVNESLIKIDNRNSKRLIEKPVLIVLMQRAMAVAAVLMVVIIGAFYLNEFMNKKHQEVAQNISKEIVVNKKSEQTAIVKEESPTSETIKFTPPVEDLQQNQKPDEEPVLSNDNQGIFSRNNKNDNNNGKNIALISDREISVVDDQPASTIEENTGESKNIETLDGDKFVNEVSSDFSVAEKDINAVTVTGTTTQSSAPINFDGNAMQYSTPVQLDQVQIISSGKKSKTFTTKTATDEHVKSESYNETDSITVDESSDLFNLAMDSKASGAKEAAIEKLDELIKLNNYFKPQALWEKALLLIALNKKEKAKTVLTDLSKIESAYKNQAIDKLKEL